MAGHLGSSLNTDLLQGFYVGDLFINPRDGRVAGRSGSVHLPPKAMEVLLCLASKPNGLVTRQSLIEDVWGAGHGSAEALNHAISEIRQALDDHHDHPKFIQTLPKRGYRLLIEPVPASRQTEFAATGINMGGRVDDIGLFENLKRRGVLETAIAYLVVGWLLIQVADIVFAQLLLPGWMATFVTSLVIAGFPIAIGLSWYLEFRDGHAVLHELSPRDASRRRFSRRYIAVMSALAISALIVSIYDVSVGLPRGLAPIEGVSASLPPIQDNAIAVLPFLNLDGSEDTQVFANGLADDVITRLSRVPGLLVSSRGDAFTLNPNSASARVRERLRVARYVEGSIESNGDIMRVTIQLVDSATGFHVLSRTFDKVRARYFEMRDEITELVVANVRVALPPETRVTHELSVADPSIDVYVLYRRGVDASRGPDMTDSIDAVLAWFDAALEIDSGYAAAHAGKCAVYVDAYPASYDPAYIDAAESSCAMALDLNPNLDVVYAALGKLYQATGRYDRSEQAYLDALEIDPNSSASLIGLGEVYRLQQRPTEAEATIRRATGLHPGDWAAYNALGNYLYRSGRYVEAAEQYRNVVALDDTSGRAHANLGTTLMLAGEFEAAEPEYRRAIELDGDAAAYTNLGLLLYYLGRFDDAIEAHREAVTLTPQDYLAHANLGDALRVSGNTDEALEVFAAARELASGALAVNSNDAFVLMDLAWINAVLGDYTRARTLIDRARSLVPDDPYVHYLDGLILDLGGDTAAALSALELAVANGYSTQMLAADPSLAGLRGNALFDEVLALTN